MVLQAKLLIIGGIAVLVPVVGVTANEALKGPSAPEQEVPIPAPAPTKVQWTPLSQMDWFQKLGLSSDTFGGKYGNQLLGADEPTTSTKPWQQIPARPVSGYTYTSAKNQPYWEFNFSQYKEEGISNASDLIFNCLSAINQKVSDMGAMGKIRVPGPDPQNKTLQEILKMCSFNGPIN